MVNVLGASGLRARGQLSTWPWPLSYEVAKVESGVMPPAHNADTLERHACWFCKPLETRGPLLPADYLLLFAFGRQRYARHRSARSGVLQSAIPASLLDRLPCQ